MEKLVDFLKQINNKEIPASTVFSDDFVEIMKAAQKDGRAFDKDYVRDYLADKNMYKDEEGLEFFMRDLYTEYVMLHDSEHKKYLKNLLESRLLTGKGKINTNAVEMLRDHGFKCYPVVYTKGSFVLGIITDVGHVMLEPR